MTTNTPPDAAGSLGLFLRDRRARLQPDPGAQGRRRTPGLRREEVAAKAGVSVTWYTWLEQGRGGPPSDEVLERLAHALELDAEGREVLFLLAQHRPPPLRPAPPPPVPPSLQRMIDALPSPVIVKTRTWDVVAWNEAAVAVLQDYDALPAHERNVLRRLFDRAFDRSTLADWEATARFAMGVFRIDVARSGGCPEAEALVADLLATNDDFRRLWAENELHGHGVAVKRLNHAVAGPLAFETTAFAVDGADGLSIIVFTPASPADARAVATLLARGDAS